MSSGATSLTKANGFAFAGPPAATAMICLHGKWRRSTIGKSSCWPQSDGIDKRMRFITPSAPTLRREPPAGPNWVKVPGWTEAHRGRFK